MKLCFSRTPKCKLVVFVTTCDSVDFLSTILSSAYPAATQQELIPHDVFKLHGDLPPAERTGANILAAPSVCAELANPCSPSALACPRVRWLTFGMQPIWPSSTSAAMAC